MGMTPTRVEPKGVVLHVRRQWNQAEKASFHDSQCRLRLSLHKYHSPIPRERGHEGLERLGRYLQRIPGMCNMIAASGKMQAFEKLLPAHARSACSQAKD